MARRRGNGAAREHRRRVVASPRHKRDVNAANRSLGDKQHTPPLARETNRAHRIYWPAHPELTPSCGIEGRGATAA